MDSICQDEEHDLGFQQFIDDQFNNLVSNFREFESTILQLPPSSINPTNVQDLVDTSPKNEKDTPILQDFGEFKSTMFPPRQFESKNAKTSSDWKFNGEIEDSEIIVHEERSENVNVTSFISGGAGEGGRVKGTFGSFTKYTNVTPYPSGDGGGCSSSGGRGGAADGLFTSYANVTTYGGGRRGVVGGSLMNAWRHTGVNVTANVPWSRRRRRRKRKYRGVYESEAEAARRMELLKIKNRVAATRSYEKKKAYEVQLKARIQNLRKENEFHKKLLKFLEGINPIDLKQKQLMRTVSCPT